MIQSELFHYLSLQKQCTGKQDDNDIMYASILQF